MPLTTDPALEAILADIDPKWRIDFAQFVRSGKARQEFLDALDSDAALQQAMERACYADEGDIREPYQTLVETQADTPESAQQDFESVLRDARLAAAALEEAKNRATRMQSDSRVNAALDDAVRASRSAVAALMSSGGGR